MEENVKNSKIETTGGKIDKEVLNIMTQDDILSAISDPKQANRLILNCFCELLSEVADMKKSCDDLMQLISVCSSDKIVNFFIELRSNVADEVKRQELHNKIKQSHKKSTKKSAKSVK